MLRLRVAAATFALAVAGLAVPPRIAHAAHPHFDDRGTLEWYRSLDEAQAVARRTGKLIFIDSGRLRCGNCRHLICDVLPSPRIRDRMSRIAIGLSDDIDRPDPRVMQILESGIPNAQMLPLVGFVTPELRWVTGWSGFTDDGTMGAHVGIAEQRFQLVQQKLRGGATAVPPPVRAMSTEPKPPEARVPAPSPAPQPVTPPAHDQRDCELPGRPGAASPSAPVQPPAPIAPAPQAARPTPPSLPVTPPPPSMPSTPRPVAATPAPSPRAPLAPPSPGTLMSRLRAAAAGARYGEVIRIGETETPSPADRAEFEGLVQRAQTWVLTSMAEAEAAARARRFPEAIRTLSVVRTELRDTQCPALTDAERGERAVRCLIAIERGSPDSAGTPEELRRQAYADFRGTRWAALFRSRA